MFKIARPNLWFLSLVLGEILFFLYEVSSSRMVYHDGFVAAANQYYLLNSLAEYGQIPLWSPYLSHGDVMGWWLILQGTEGFLMKALGLFPALIKSIPFSTAFFSSFFIDRLALLAGTWLLGGLYFRSDIARFVVCAAVMCSSFVYTAPAFDFYLFYAFPLLIYVTHRFVQSQALSWLFLSVFLFAAQAVGSPAYFVPVLSLAVFIYWLAWAVCRFGDLKACARRMKPGRSLAVCAAACALLMAAVFMIMRAARDPWTVQTNMARNSDDAVSLQTFLTYAGNTDLSKWNELFLGVSPALDFTLYFGLLGLVLAAVGFCKGQGKARVVALSAGFLFLVSSASPLSALVFYGWPLMKYYRHLALLSPLVKLWLCFLAGFGFDLLFSTGEQDKDRRRQGFAITLVILCVCGFYLVQLAQDPGLKEWLLAEIVHAPGMRGIPLDPSMIDLGRQTQLIGGLAVVLAALFFTGQDERKRGLLLAALVLFHVSDCYGYRIAQTQIRTFQMPKDMKAWFVYRPLEYVSKRSVDPIPAEERGLALPGPLSWGGQYHIWSHLTRSEPVGTYFRTDHVQRSFWDYLRVYQPSLGQEGQTQGMFNTAFLTAKEMPESFQKFSAVSLPKVQFFKKAVTVPDALAMSRLMQDKNYQGDQLFVLEPKGPTQAAVCAKDAGACFQESQRAQMPYQVTFFSPNKVKVKADNLFSEPVWMFYSDAWHPQWKARVNGQEVRLYQANMAYKALRLPPGANEAEFIFQDGGMQVLVRFFAVLSLVWLVLIGWFLKHCFI